MDYTIRLVVTRAPDAHRARSVATREAQTHGATLYSGPWISRREEQIQVEFVFRADEDWGEEKALAAGITRGLSRSPP